MSTDTIKLSWDENEKAYIKLGQAYLFEQEAYKYCETKGAPIAVIYYDTKTSAPSKTLYSNVF